MRPIEQQMTFYSPLLKRGIRVMPSLILVPQWAKDNAAYLTHEQVHAAQQRRGGVLVFWFKYLTKSAHRQAYEVEAYQAQIAHGAKLSYCASQLAYNYDLDLDYNAAKQLLEAA